MEAENSKAGHLADGIAKAGGGLLKIVGIALLMYVVGMTIFAISKYTATKSTLLSYGMSDATGTLIAWAVMFIAIGIPGLAIFRLFFFRGRPYDYAAVMILPLISWGMTLIPANFDAVTGEALKYCANRPDNTLFCLDRPGIDPLTQKKLVPMNPSLADMEFRKNRGLAPKRITQPVTDIAFFDPLTAQPRVWVHKNDQGCYDMFDNPGADPHSGEPLSPITKEVVRIIKQCGNTTARNQERVSNVKNAAVQSRPVTSSAIPLASSPQSEWPKLTIPPNGKSPMIPAVPGMRIMMAGNNFRNYTVYRDGSECAYHGTVCPNQSIGAYAKDESGVANIIVYAYEPMK